MSLMMLIENIVNLCDKWEEQERVILFRLCGKQIRDVIIKAMLGSELIQLLLQVLLLTVSLNCCCGQYQST